MLAFLQIKDKKIETLKQHILTKKREEMKKRQREKKREKEKKSESKKSITFTIIRSETLIVYSLPISNRFY